ncbi:lysophospholipase [Flavobacterium sp. SM15]|uniref:alpha/beta hydrolase n=1 Tax=Flavobacterium sp. SM15 TaxID=2908005 RepID=UPI001EDB10DA|nr:alpha/beta fold hydrolase [Flavobacterium sp. SM15]MCG2611119.1 lysophospholipase [Flavobacterium sp. SM15]
MFFTLKISRFVIFGFLLFFISCKTIEIQEKNAFRDSKYNYDFYEKQLEHSKLSQENKNQLHSILYDLVKTDKTEIVTNDSIAIRRDFFKPNDSIKLEYFEFTPKNYKKSGLFFLGNGSTILRVFNELKEMAIASQTQIYVLNYRGYGKSEGEPSFKTVFKDNQAFLNLIQKSNKIDFVIGYSLGTVSATYLATDNKINELILLSPISNARESISVIKKRQTRGVKSVVRPFIKLTMPEYLADLSNNEKIKAYKGKVIVMHSKDDETLPYSMGLGVYRSITSPNKEFISLEHGGHKAPFEQSNWNMIIDRLK